MDSKLHHIHTHLQLSHIQHPPTPPNTLSPGLFGGYFNLQHLEVVQEVLGDSGMDEDSKLHHIHKHLQHLHHNHTHLHQFSHPSPLQALFGGYFNLQCLEVAQEVPGHPGLDEEVGLATPLRQHEGLGVEVHGEVAHLRLPDPQLLQRFREQFLPQEQRDGRVQNELVG